MDLTGRIRRWALGRPRVLVIDAPGGERFRWQLEDELDRRHWPLALSPADTDLALVLGRPGAQLAAAIELLWSQVPQPRHRQDIAADGDLPAQLDAASVALVDAANRTEPVQPGAQTQLGNLGPEPDDVDDEHAGHSGHEGHHMHHGGDVAGLAMADTAPDRDGLTLDVLRVALGPVLPGWPTGLVLTGSMQGDVLTGVELAWVDGSDDPNHGVLQATPQAVAMDQLARILLVAGWPTAAAAARRARRDLSGSHPQRAAQTQRAAARVASRVRGSRALRWSVQGIGCTDRGMTPAGSAHAAGDVWGGVRHWCDVAAGGEPVPVAGSPRSLTEASILLEGSELAAARLVVATMDLERPATRVETESTGV
ncbi:MAG: hypothetical protein ACR2GM_10125 [Nocardioidaceae bacterium]